MNNKRAGHPPLLSGAAWKAGAGLRDADRHLGAQRWASDWSPGPLSCPALLSLGTRALDLGARCWHIPHNPWCVGGRYTHRQPRGMVTFESRLCRWALSCFDLWLHLKGDTHQQVVAAALVERQEDCQVFADDTELWAGAHPHL